LSGDQQGRAHLSKGMHDNGNCGIARGEVSASIRKRRAAAK